MRVAYFMIWCHKTVSKGPSKSVTPRWRLKTLVDSWRRIPHSPLSTTQLQMLPSPQQTLNNHLFSRTSATARYAQRPPRARPTPGSRRSTGTSSSARPARRRTAARRDRPGPNRLRTYRPPTDMPRWMLAWCSSSSRSSRTWRRRTAGWCAWSRTWSARGPRSPLGHRTLSGWVLDFW